MDPGLNSSYFTSNHFSSNHHQDRFLSAGFSNNFSTSNTDNIINNHDNHGFNNLLHRNESIEIGMGEHRQELHQQSFPAWSNNSQGSSYAPVKSTMISNFVEQRQEIVPMPRSTPLPSFETLVDSMRNGNPGRSFLYGNVDQYQQSQTAIRSDYSMVNNNNIFITEIQSTFIQSCNIHNLHNSMTLVQSRSHRTLPRQQSLAHWHFYNSQRLQTAEKVMWNHQTHELALWPCLRNLSIGDLCNITKFYVVDNGFSMFILTRHGGVFLYKKGSSYGQQLFILPNTELILFQSISSQYLHFMSRDKTLWVWSNATNKSLMLGISHPHNEGINLVMKDVLKFRSNKNHCLALNGRSKLYVWGLIFDQEHKEYPSSEDVINNGNFQAISLPTCLNQYFHKPDNPKIIDFDCGLYGSVILLRSDDNNNDNSIYIYCFGNWNHSFTPMLTKVVYVQIYRVIAGKQIFLLLAKDGSVYRFKQGSLAKLPTERRFASAVCIPSSDAFLLLDMGNGQRYLWNYKNEEKLMPTHTNSIPDLLSLYGCYPSTFRLSTIAPGCLEAGSIARLRAFNNPFYSNFKIKFPIDADMLPATIYAERQDLIKASAYYRNLLQEQFPSLHETLELDFCFIDYYYFLKKQYVDLDCERILGKDIHDNITKIGQKPSSWKLYKRLGKIDENERNKKNLESKLNRILILNDSEQMKNI